MSESQVLIFNIMNSSHFIVITTDLFSWLKGYFNIHKITLNIWNFYHKQIKFKKKMNFLQYQ
jgi:hypothetical protein